MKYHWKVFLRVASFKSTHNWGLFYLNLLDIVIFAFVVSLILFAVFSMTYFVFSFRCCILVLLQHFELSHWGTVTYLFYYPSILQYWPTNLYNISTETSETELLMLFQGIKTCFFHPQITKPLIDIKCCSWKNLALINPTCLQK